VEFEELLNSGIQASQAGNYQMALALFDQALNLNPKNPHTWIYQGMALIQLERYAEAILSLENAIELNPNDHHAWCNRSSALDSLGLYQEALTSSDRALALDPNCPTLWTTRGYILANGFGLYEEALDCFNNFLALNPNEYNAWKDRGGLLQKLGRYEEAIASYDRALTINPDFPNTWKVWHSQGICHYKLGCSEEPLTNQGDASHIVNYLPTDRSGYLEKALACFNRALAIKPNSLDTLIRKADVLMALCRFEEALISYNYVIDLNPNDCVVWHNRGIVLEKLRRSEEALASYDYALHVNPDFVYAWYHRANLLVNQFRRYEEALISYNRTIDLNPNIYQAWHGYGWVLNALGRFKEAITSHERALSITLNQYWPSWLDKGRAVLNLQGYKAAIQIWSEGLHQLQQETPGYEESCGELHHAIGDARYQEGRQQENPYPYWREAKKSLQKALKFLQTEAFAEKHLEVLLDLVTVCRGLGQVELAQELLRHGTDLLGRLLWAIPSDGQKILLERRFVKLNQLRIDELVQSGQQVEALELAEERKNTCLSWLRYGWSDTVASPKYQDIQKLLNSHTAAIYWHVSPAAITTFILRQNKLLKTFVLRYDQPPRLLSAETMLDNSTYAAAARKLQDLENWLTDWKQDYKDYKIQGEKGWRQEIPTRLNELGQILNIAEILPYLYGIDQLILLPHRDLHLLPLNALFPERFTIRYLPSAQVGLDQQQVQFKVVGKRQTTSVLNVENSQENLPYAAVESTAIAQLYPDTKHIRNSAVTQVAVTQALQSGAGIFHFSGHAEHDLNLPSESSLHLTNDERLTLRDIFELDMSSYNLVCLCACETGMTGKQGLIDEFVGLASGFLAAGTINVVSSLWQVNDVSTAFLIIRFYENLRTCPTVAIALNQAQKWLRNLTSEQFEIVLSQFKPQIDEILAQLPTPRRRIAEASLRQTCDRKLYPFANPYYWAAFTATGF
jgi:CHAT domain-containing protein/Flp pilus assembly protein TadD